MSDAADGGDTLNRVPHRPGEITPVGLFRLLVRNRRAYAVAAAAAVAVGAIWIFVVAPKFTAESAFILQTPSAEQSQLAGLAAQFGFTTTGSGGGTETVNFYAALLESRSLREGVVTTEFRVPDGSSASNGRTATLVEIFGVEGDTERERLHEAVEELAERVNVEIAMTSGIVSVRTTSVSPELAVAMNRRLLDLLNDFNLRRRQSTAAAERTFVEGRLAAARRELEEAEGALSRFLESNRRFDSPQLTFEQGRLDRRVSLRQQVYVSLAQKFEEARINEIRNTPLITVIDPPEGSARPSSPGVLAVVLAALLGAAVLVTALVFVKEFLTRARDAAPRERDEQASVGGTAGQRSFDLVRPAPE